jgi:phenylacetate-CoA ligase
MLETGAQALGCTVVAAGTGQTEQQVQAIAELAPDGYVGTPSFLKIILDKADEQGIRLPSLRKALVSGEAFPPSLRDALVARGIAAYQVYASADLGATPTRPKRARVSSSTRVCWSRSCVPAPAIPWRRARSARSS